MAKDMKLLHGAFCKANEEMKDEIKNNQLKAKVEQWKALPRNNLAELAVADAYFDTELMPLSRDIFLMKQEQRNTEACYGMMLTLGTSWQPLALSISFFKPQKLLIICTKDTQAQLESLKNFLQLSNVNYDKIIVDRCGSEEIYKAMKAFYARYAAGGKLCVDITGGTKAMSSSAAIMAAVLGLDIYYVESKYLPLYRRPEPGSEELKALANPQEI